MPENPKYRVRLAVAVAGVAASGLLALCVSPALASTPTDQATLQPSPAITETIGPEPTPTVTIAPEPTPTVTVTPEPTPTPTPTVTVTPEPPKPHPYPPKGPCGVGYHVIDSHHLGTSAVVYLMRNKYGTRNCVLTTLAHFTGKKVKTLAFLQRMDGALAVARGKNFAGPASLHLTPKHSCIIWGGAYGSLHWKSKWAHCG